MLISIGEEMLYNCKGFAANISVWNTYTRKYYYTQEITALTDVRQKYIL